MRIWTTFRLYCCCVLSSVAHAQPSTAPSLGPIACQFSEQAQHDIEDLGQSFILMSRFFKYNAEQFYFISDPNQPRFLLNTIPIKKIIYSTQSNPQISLITFELNTDIHHAKMYIEYHLQINFNLDHTHLQYTASKTEHGFYETFGLSQKDNRLFFYCGQKAL